MKILLTSILTVLIAISAFGETPADSVKVYFLAGRRLFDPSLGNNRAVMDGFIKKVREAKEQDNIDFITVSGYASPEGASDLNQRLSRLRCEEISSYIVKHTGIDGKKIETHADGVAWTELRDLVARTPDMPSQKKVLYILDNTPLWIYNSEKTKIIDGRKKQLMELEGGLIWNWMMENLFPELRNAVAVVLFLKHEIPTSETNSTEGLEEVIESAPTSSSDLNNHDDAQDIERIDGIEDIEGIEEIGGIEDIEGIEDIIDPEDIKDRKGSDELNVLTAMTATHGEAKPFYMALKTNMLYDAALIPNLGAEFYVGKDLSIYGEWMYAWWDNDRRHRYWRTYGGDIGLRWWFGRKAHAKPLTGHHLGIYGGILTFDFEAGDTGYMGGKPGGTLWDRWLVNSGIEYGYSLPVAKRLNIDFSIAFGYLGGNYIKYYPFDNDYYFDKEYNMHYFGPTKAEITLVWLIGKGNTNSRKGGDR